MTRTFQITQEAVDRFVEFTGDRNAQHTDEQFARRFRYRRRVVHGMLAFSHLLPLAAAGFEGTGGGGNPGRVADLCDADTRFLKPVFVGDPIRLEVQRPPGPAADGLLPYEAAWHHGRSGELLIRSKGSFRLIPNAPETGPQAGEAIPTEGWLAEPVDENVLTADQLEGRTERIAFRITAAARYAREVLGVSDPSSAAGGAVGASSLATLLLSTLVGMRLPGRYATFTHFNIAFARPLAFGLAYALRGRTGKVTAATESAQIEFSIDAADGGASLAGGRVTSMVGAPPRPVIACDEIRRSHLDAGLRDKVAVVTGASRGIGAATAKLLAMHGAGVVVNYFKGSADADDVVRDIRSAGGRAVAVGCDVADEAQAKAMFEQTRREFGGLDVLVNCAVRDFQARDFADLSWADYQAEIDVSVKGLFHCCQAAVPLFRQRGAGKIVNLATIAVDNPVKGQSKYITAKAAVVGFTRALARELAGENIQVNALAPTMTETDLLAAMPGAIVKRVAQYRPAGRNLEPIEVAQAIVFLAGGWSNGMTGQNLVLNLGEPPFK